MRVEKTWSHPEFVDLKVPDYSAPFDIALLKLAEEVDMQKFPPVCLPAIGDNFDGDSAWAVGNN